MLQRDAETAARQTADKIPQWAEYADKLHIPSSLNLEQCSSGASAEYKASVARKFGTRIADLTGGLGVDSWAFGKTFGEVLHNERDIALSSAVEANFQLLGIGNVRFTTFDVTAEQDPSASDWLNALKDFHPDVIYADPARRDGCGHKLVLPEDCSPDIRKLMPPLLKTAPVVMVKFSPMMDIEALRRCFGHSLRELHIVCVDTELKELLCVFGTEEIIERMFICNNGTVLPLNLESEKTSHAKYLCDGSELQEYPLLFEPGPALLKAGLFKFICSRYGMTKTGHSTHLYLCNAVIPELKAFGKFYTISSSLPFCKKSFRRIAELWPHADITARNLPVSTDNLRKKINITPGNNISGVHIFALRVDCDNQSSERTLLITRAAI